MTLKKVYKEKVRNMNGEQFENTLCNAKNSSLYNQLLAVRGADQIHSIDDLTSIYSSEREQFGAFKPNSGFKRCKAPYDSYFTSYDGEILGPVGKVVKTNVNNAGYEYVGVLVNGKSTTTTVHRLVASAWVENDDPENKRVVDHKDDNKLNNSADNLQWLTYSQNLTKSHRMKQMAGHKGAKNQGVAIVKVDSDGTHTTYHSASAAAKSNNLSAVSVTGNAKGQLKLDRPYHFELAQK